MAVVTVTGTIEITLPSENTEEIDVFMKKYKHLTPYLFNDDDYLGYNCVEIDSSTDEEDTTLLSVIADNIESCGFGFGHRAEPLPKLFYSDLFNLIKDSGEYYFTTIKASVFDYSDYYSASGKLTKDGIKWDVDDLEEESKSAQEEYEEELMNSIPQVELTEQDLIDVQFIYDYSDLIEVLQGFTDEGHELFTIDNTDWRQYKLYAVLEVAINTKSLPKEVYNDWFVAKWRYNRAILEHILQQESNEYFAGVTPEGVSYDDLKQISINKN
jgi:hypothetical protein